MQNWGKTNLKIVLGGVSQVFNLKCLFWNDHDYCNFSFLFWILKGYTYNWWLKIPTASLPAVLFQLQRTQLMLNEESVKADSISIRAEGTLCACRCSRECVSTLAILLGFMRLSWLAAEPTDIQQARGKGLQSKVIFRLSKNCLLEKVRIKMNSERDLIECDKSLPHTFLAHRIGESKKWKMCFDVPKGGKKTMELSFFTLKILHLAQHLKLGHNPIPQQKTKFWEYLIE